MTCFRIFRPVAFVRYVSLKGDMKRHPKGKYKEACCRRDFLGSFSGSCFHQQKKTHIPLQKTYHSSSKATGKTYEKSPVCLVSPGASRGVSQLFLSGDVLAFSFFWGENHSPKGMKFVKKVGMKTGTSCIDHVIHLK